jgi:spore germination protein KB
MLESGKINYRQAFFIVITLLASSSMIYAPVIAAGVARQDAWLCMIVATLAGLIIAWLVMSLVLRFPGKNLFEIPELILGRVPGKIIAFLYVLWCIHIEVLLYSEFGAFMLNAVLPGTPMVVNHIVATVLMAYIARNGLEVLARFNELIFPVFIFAFFLLIVLSSKNMAAVRLLPVYDEGMAAILKGAAGSFAWLGEIFGLAAIIPYLNKPGQALRVVILATLVSGLLLTSGAIYTITVLGPDLTASSMYPMYSSVRMISIANFLERLEVIPVALWIVVGMTKDTFFRYFAILGAAQCFGLKDYRLLALPVGVVVIAASLLLYQDLAVQVTYAKEVWPFTSLLFEAVIPLLLLVVSVARGLGNKKTPQK